MQRRKITEVSTIVIDGDYESMKAAFGRSLLGVTYIQFKKKRNEFYQHQAHNSAVTTKICEAIHQFLLNKTDLADLKKYKIKINFKPIWDDTGKILGISDLKLTVYLKVGELIIPQAQVLKEQERIKVDFFYSDNDFASQALLEKLPKLLDEKGGKEIFDYNTYNLNTLEGKEKAAVYKGIKYAPTVVIENDILQNPNEKTLCSRLEMAFNPEIYLNNPVFEMDNDIALSRNAITISLINSS